MAIRTLLTGLDNAMLRAACAPVTTFGAELKALVQDLRDTMLEPTSDGSTTGIGIAAPQIGVLQQVCLVTLHIDSKKDDRVLLLINPEIIESSPHMISMEEGCLSLPETFGKVRRPSKVKVRWQTIDGQWAERRFSGWDARIIQHEVDHLHGVLFPDYSS